MKKALMSVYLYLMGRMVIMYKVLIVEDEKMIRKGLRYTFDWLKADCVVVGEASNGKVGLKEIERLEPDIVLVDITMPIMDGITMIEKSVENYIYSAIILSGYDEFEFAKKAIKLGVSEYLLKPVEEAQLFEALERAKEQVQLKKQCELLKDKSIDIEEIEVLPVGFFQDDFQGSKPVLESIKYIKQNYYKKIGMQDLVKVTDMSSTYLNEKFKEETTYTFNEFLNRYRIQKSINYMKKGRGKIYTIASDVGFSNYRYFISVFKKYVNCLPGDFLEYFRNI